MAIPEGIGDISAIGEEAGANTVKAFQSLLRLVQQLRGEIASLRTKMSTLEAVDQNTLIPPTASIRFLTASAGPFTRPEINFTESSAIDLTLNDRPAFNRVALTVGVKYGAGLYLSGGNLCVDINGAFNWTGPHHFSMSDGTKTPITVRAHAAQSAPLIHAESAAGTLFFEVDYLGVTTMHSGAIISEQGSQVAFFGSGVTGSRIDSYATLANAGLTVNKANVTGSHTGPIMDFLRDGTSVAQITRAGSLAVSPIAPSTPVFALSANCAGKNTYTITGGSVSRSINLGAFTLNDLGNLVGTLINDLKSMGVQG